MNTLITLTEMSYAIIFGLVGVLLCKHIYFITKTFDINQKIAYRCIVITSVWYLLSLGLSINGFFHDPTKFSKGDYLGLICLLVMMSIPLITFFLLLKNKLFRNLIDLLSLKFITGLLTYRIIGGVYLSLLLFDKRAPALFAIPPAILDAFIGITALIVSSGKFQSTKIPRTWNYIGIFDFVLAFSIYFLYFPFKILSVSPDKIMWGGFYPMAFIVMFVAPLSTILHISALIKLSKT